MNHIELKFDKLYFHEYDINIIGSGKYCPSFVISINYIKYIAISPRLLFDDEIMFILIVDKDNYVHKMPDNVIFDEGIRGVTVF